MQYRSGEALTRAARGGLTAPNSRKTCTWAGGAAVFRVRVGWHARRGRSAPPAAWARHSRQRTEPAAPSSPSSCVPPAHLLAQLKVHGLDHLPPHHLRLGGAGRQREGRQRACQAVQREQQVGLAAGAVAGLWVRSREGRGGGEGEGAGEGLVMAGTQPPGGAYTGPQSGPTRAPGTQERPTPGRQRRRAPSPAAMSASRHSAATWPCTISTARLSGTPRSWARPQMNLRLGVAACSWRWRRSPATVQMPALAQFDCAAAAGAAAAAAAEVLLPGLGARPRSLPLCAAQPPHLAGGSPPSIE